MLQISLSGPSLNHPNVNWRPTEYQLQSTHLRDPPLFREGGRVKEREKEDKLCKHINYYNKIWWMLFSTMLLGSWWERDCLKGRVGREFENYLWEMSDVSWAEGGIQVCHVREREPPPMGTVGRRNSARGASEVGAGEARMGWSGREETSLLSLQLLPIGPNCQPVLRARHLTDAWKS